MDSYTVSSCLCHSCSFEKIKQVAADRDIETVEQLQEEDICGTSCGMCIPYVEMVLENGQTAFKPGEYYRKSG